MLACVGRCSPIRRRYFHLSTHTARMRWRRQSGISLLVLTGARESVRPVSVSANRPAVSLQNMWYRIFRSMKKKSCGLLVGRGASPSCCSPPGLTYSDGTDALALPLLEAGAIPSWLWRPCGSRFVQFQQHFMALFPACTTKAGSVHIVKRLALFFKKRAVGRPVGRLISSLGVCVWRFSCM